MASGEEYLKKLQNPLWYGDQDDNGVDLSLIRENTKSNLQMGRMRSIRQTSLRKTCMLRSTTREMNSYY